MATPFWYNTALHLLKPFYRWRIKRRAESLELYHQECLERFGPFEDPKNVKAIWFHAVSVGGNQCCTAFNRALSQTWAAGFSDQYYKNRSGTCQVTFLKEPYLDLFQAVYLPVDQKPLLKQFFESYQPRLLALVETELWPNLIDQAKLQHVPCLLLNARLSEKSAKVIAKSQV